MEEGIPKINKDTINDTIAKISIIQSDMHVMGSNDSEISDTMELIEKLKRGEISEEKALEIAQGIIDRKMDYH